MPSIITDSFTHDHRRCDHLLAAAETIVDSNDWAAIESSAEALIDAMNRHFALEEDTLFPELARVFLVAANPIEVMRSEHAQMRQLFEDLSAAVRARDRDVYLGVIETLHFAVQQHNSKEECVLYPMADGALKARGPEIAEMIASV